LSREKRVLDFAPFEFAAQDFEIGFARRLDESEAVGRTGDADAILGFHGNAFLAVESQEDGLGVARQFDFDAGRIAYDDGPVGERVRANGRDDEGFDRRVNDRAAGGEGIGSGTGGCGDDETVGAITADKIVVDEELELDHASESALINDGIVQDVLAIEHLAVAQKFDLEHDALAHGRAAGEGLFERGVEFVDGEAGQKAEAAHVDGKNGDATSCGDARGGEERAISAENEKDFRFVGKLLARMALGRIRQSGSGFFIVHHAQALRFEPMEQRRDDCGEIGAARTRNHADGLESLRCWHTV
jgi:hypothetical protein